MGMKDLKTKSQVFFATLCFMIGLCGFIVSTSLEAKTISELMSGDLTADWDFMQKNGGIKLAGTEKLAKNKYQLMFKCDISQNKDDIKPRVIRQFLHRRTSGKIYVSIVYGKPASNLIGQKNTAKIESPICPALEISNIETGDYKVYFDDRRGPYLLSEIELK